MACRLKDWRRSFYTPATRRPRCTANSWCCAPTWPTSQVSSVHCASRITLHPRLPTDITTRRPAIKRRWVLPQVALHTGSLEITEAAIANKNCDPWDQIDGFQALLNSSEAQATRISDIQNSLIVRWVDSNTDWVGADGIGFAYASAPLFPIGAPARVNITRDGQVVDTLAVGQFEPAGNPVHGFWSWKGHWLLEMDSVLVQDGKVMNPILGYAEIFEWHLVNDEPFYFFQKNSSYGISYAGQELPLRYDDIIHGQLCCDPARYSIISTPTGAWFYALRDDIWYLVHVQVN